MANEGDAPATVESNIGARIALRALGMARGGWSSSSDSVLAIRKFQRLFGLPITGIINEATAGGLTKVSSKLRLPSEKMNAEFNHLAGMAKSQGIGPLHVIVKKAMVGRISETEIGRVDVNEDGFFHMPLVPADYTHIRVLVVDAQEATAYESGAIRIQQEMWLEWSATGVFGYPGRIDLLLTRFKEFLPQGFSLQVSDDDISLLAGQLGLDLSELTVLIIGTKFASNTGLDPSIAALLFEKFGFAGDAAADFSTWIGPIAGPRRPESSVSFDALTERAGNRVLSQDVGQLPNVLRAAVEEGDISDRFSTRGSIEEAQRLLRAAQYQHLLTRPLGISKDSCRLDQVLKYAKVDRIDDVIEMEAFRAGTTSTLAFLTEKGRSIPVGESLKSMLEIGPWLAHRFDAMKAAYENGWTSPKRMAQAGDSAHRQVLGPHLSDEQFMDMSDRLHLRFPGDLLVAMHPMTPVVKTVLAELGDGFDLYRDSIDEVLKAGPRNMEIREELSTYQRVLRTTHDARTAKPLLDAKLTSAHAIARLSQPELTAVFEDSGFPSADAKRVAVEIHKNAQGRKSGSLELFLQNNRAFNRGPRAADFSARLTAADEEFLKLEFPTFEKLFGSQDYCDCGDCASVLSPAAYLVDSLLWLKRFSFREGPEFKTLLDMLRTRRPEIPQLLLNCANTKTELPRIDLICEHLESMVVKANINVPEFAGITIDTKKWQTEKSLDRILSYPEHLIPQVYDFLSKQECALISFRLPHDLPLAEIRAYLTSSGVSRKDLLMAFGGSEDDIAIEILGLGQGIAAEILNKQDNSAYQQKVWGSSIAAGKCTQTEFARRIRAPKGDRRQDGEFLSPEDFEELRNLTLKDVQVNLVGDACSGDSRLLSGLTPGNLDLTHRFLRLLRFVPWTAGELGALLEAQNGIRDIDTWALKALASFSRLRTGLDQGVSEEELLLFWRGFSPSDVHSADAGSDHESSRPSPYQKLFLNGLENHRDKDAIQAFQVDILAADSSLTPPRQNTFRRQLCAALKLSDTDFDAHLGGNRETALTLGNLSGLFRKCICARLAGWTLADLEMMKNVNVVGVISQPAELEAFLDDAALIKDMGLIPKDIFEWPRVVSAPDYVKQAFSPLKNQEKRKWGSIVADWLKIDPRFGAAFGLIKPLENTLGSLSPKDQDVVDGLSALARLAGILIRSKVLPEQAAYVIRIPSIAKLATSEEAASHNFFWPLLKSALKWLRLARRFPAAGLPRISEYAILADTNTTSQEALQNSLAFMLAKEPKELASIWSPPPSLIERQSAEWVARMAEKIRLCRLLKVSGSVLTGWATNRPNSAQAAEVRDTIRSGVPEAEWLTVSSRVQNELRNARCAALVDYVIGSGQFPSVNELSRQLLLDVKDDACAMTTRIVEAYTGIQTFVRYCNDGSIPNGATFDEKARRQMLWRGEYNRWVANRSVFLYPENYLRSGVRSSASYQFKESQSVILQGKTTKEAIEKGIEKYLDGLQEVANLDYMAVDGDLDEEAQLLARSRSAPRNHFYRSSSSGRWSPWEKLPMPIPSDHLVIKAVDDNVYIGWPTWTEQANESQSVSAPGSKAPDGAPSYILLSYSWAIRDSGGWTEIRQGDRFVVFEKQPYKGKSNLVSIARRVADIPQLGWPRPAGATVVSSAKVAFDSYLCGIDNPDSPQLGKWHLKLGHYEVDRAMLNVTYQFLPQSPGTDLPWGYLCTGRDPNGLLWIRNSPLITYLQRLTIEPWVMTDANQLPFLCLFPDTVVFDLPVIDNRYFGAAGISLRIKAGERITFNTITPPTNYQLASPHELYSRYVIAVTDADRSFLAQVDGRQHGEEFAYFMPGHHPFANGLHTLSKRSGIGGLFQAALQEQPSQFLLDGVALDYKAAYKAGQASSAVNLSYLGGPNGNEELSFSETNPYAVYNWELFFHLPIWAADQLRADMKHEEAQGFYECVFNPFPTEKPDPLKPFDLSRFWITKPLRELARKGTIESIRDILRGATASKSNPWSVIEQAPFDPHEVARTRHASYARYAVMRYLDNLMDWADGCLSAGGRNNIELARALYMKAEDLLGPKPERFRRPERRKDVSFEENENQWDGGGNLLVEFENMVPIDFMGKAGSNAAGRGSMDLDFGFPLVRATAADGSPLQALYFCVPPNEYLLGYWDRVSGALRKIRECKFPAPIFESPIDPQSLADAVGAGKSLEAVLGGGIERPSFRFPTVAQKAHAILSDVKSLGSQFKDALEKRDVEMLATLKRTHENQILNETKKVRQKQIEQAEAEIVSLETSKVMIEQRRSHYSALSKEFMTELEEEAFRLHVTSTVLDAAGLIVDLASSGVAAIPDFTMGVAGFSGTPLATVHTGGSSASAVLSKLAQALTRTAGLVDRAAGMVTIQSGYERRKGDWDFLVLQANAEKDHVDMQIAAAKLRSAIAQAEMTVHDLSTQHQAVMDSATQARFTNEQLYDWYGDKLGRLYKDTFTLAINACRKVEQCLTFERKDVIPTLESLAGKAWDSMHRGLAAGDELSLWLHQMEQEYLMPNPSIERIVRRDFHMSEFAPSALKELKTLGKTSEFTLPNWWFSHKDGGLSSRRLRTFAVSIPCVLGSGRQLDANLTLKRPATETGLLGITLSGGINDTGWDASAMSDRYGPFEGLPLDNDTSWILSFSDQTELDVGTISEVVFHIEYSAKSGSASPKPRPDNHMGIFDLRRMFSNEWAIFVGNRGEQKLKVDVAPCLSFYFKKITKLNMNANGAGIFGADGNKIPSLSLVLPQTGTEVEFIWSGAWKDPQIAILVVGLDTVMHAGL